MTTPLYHQQGLLIQGKRHFQTTYISTAAATTSISQDGAGVDP